MQNDVETRVIIKNIILYLESKLFPIKLSICVIFLILGYLFWKIYRMG
jgi:hypothetical protein